MFYLTSNLIFLLTFAWFFCLQTFMLLKSSHTTETGFEQSQLLVNEKKKYISNSVFLKASLLNIFFFLLLFSNINDFYFFSNNIYWCYVTKNLVVKLTLTFFFFLFFYFNFKACLNSTKTWNLISLNFFFFFTTFFFFSFNFLNVVFHLEFINIGILLYLVTSISLEKVSLSYFKKNKLFNNKLNWPFYFIISILNNFFFLFIFTVFFFFFFIIFFEDNLYFSSIYTSSTLNMFSVPSTLSLMFIFVFFLKVGSAPFFVWKIEVFNNLSYFFLLFYNTAYFAFFSFFFFLFFNYFDMFFFSYEVIFFTIVLNLAFLSVSIFNVNTLKSFLILSTLINFNFLLFTFLLSENNLLVSSIFFLVFFNYVLCSFSLIFFFIFFFKSDVNFLHDIRNYSNLGLSSFFLFLPLCSLAGVAPTLGFLAKFLILVNSSNSYSFFLSFLFYFFIVISTVFYFNTFKSFFYVDNVSLKKRVSLTYQQKPTNSVFFFIVFFACCLASVSFIYLNLVFSYYAIDFFYVH